MQLQYNLITAFVRQMTQLVNAVGNLKLNKAPPQPFAHPLQLLTFYITFLSHRYDSYTHKKTQNKTKKKYKEWNHQCNVGLASTLG